MSLEINKLLEIEREAEERIKKAREEAEGILDDAEKTEFSEIEKEYGDEIDEGRAKIIDEHRKMADDLYSKGLKKIEATADYTTCYNNIIWM